MAEIDYDVIVIGSGIGGLIAGSLLARYGKRALICESHGIPGVLPMDFNAKAFILILAPPFIVA